MKNYKIKLAAQADKIKYLSAEIRKSISYKITADEHSHENKKLVKEIETLKSYVLDVEDICKVRERDAIRRIDIKQKETTIWINKLDLAISLLTISGAKSYAKELVNRHWA